MNWYMCDCNSIGLYGFMWGKKLMQHIRVTENRGTVQFSFSLMAWKRTTGLIVQCQVMVVLLLLVYFFSILCYVLSFWKWLLSKGEGMDVPRDWHGETFELICFYFSFTCYCYKRMDFKVKSVNVLDLSQACFFRVFWHAGVRLSHVFIKYH